MGKYNEAIQCYDKVIKVHPRYVDAWIKKGISWYHLSEYGEAIKCYDKAIELEPYNVAALIEKGKSLYKVGQPEEAINCYDEALEIEHKNANVWNSKGWTLDELGRYEEAIGCYNKALAIDPKYEEVLNNKHRAISKYTQVLYGRGNDLKRLGRYQEAINSYNRILELAPEYLDAWYHKGLSLSNLKKYQEAIECFDRIIEMNPNHADAWNDKGISLYNLGKYQEAIECFDRAIKIDPDHSTAQNNKDSRLKYVSKPYESNVYNDPTLPNYDPRLPANKRKDGKEDVDTTSILTADFSEVRPPKELVNTPTYRGAPISDWSKVLNNGVNENLEYQDGDAKNVAIGNIIEIEGLEKYFFKIEKPDKEDKLKIEIEDRINRYTLLFDRPRKDENNDLLIRGAAEKLRKLGMLARGPELKMELVIPTSEEQKQEYGDASLSIKALKGKKYVFHDTILISNRDAQRLRKYIRENFE